MLSVKVLNVFKGLDYNTHTHTHTHAHTHTHVHTCTQSYSMLESEGTSAAL